MEEQIQSTEAPQVEQPQVEQTQPEVQESSPGLQFFDNVEDLAESFNDTPQQEEAVEAQPEPQQFQETPYVDPDPAPSVHNDETISDEEAERMMLDFMSERLGKQVSSFDDFNSTETPQPQLDERVSAIAKFVEETGRSPEDWFAYQRLNPSEMDDYSAVRVHMATEYSSLSPEEVNTLMQGKYKLNPDVYSQEEVKMGQLQLKMDAQNAKDAIGRMRDSYKLPVQQQSQVDDDPIITDEWVSNMSREVDALTGLEFDLGNGKTWTFGLNDQYKSTLKEKNAKLDEFFDPYVRNDGSWDYDTLSSHRTVLDNIDHIVSSVYRQGLSDGQRGVVSKAANISTKAPVQSQAPTSNPLTDQLRTILGNGNKMTFNI
jgi:hypothetical protein